ncbi:hypothetical protein EDC01DRAFT_763093 [Geopyxis carbonaria]|nr:hypothetical protein EDC01DRAFT_763093 [Geopyxis carbonaria]
MGLSKPDTQNTDKLPVRLVLCLDGTGNTADGSFNPVTGEKEGSYTNIRTIYDLTVGGRVQKSNGKEIFQVYVLIVVVWPYRVGTINASEEVTVLKRANALIQGGTGKGSNEHHKKKTSRWLMSQIAAGYLDIICNAYKISTRFISSALVEELIVLTLLRLLLVISRALASFLQHVGILSNPESSDIDFKQQFAKLLPHYMSRVKKSMFPWSKNKTTVAGVSKGTLPHCKRSPRVRFLGAFDTVKSVTPLPISVGSWQATKVDFEMDAPGIVDNFRHALALNEARPLFSPDLWQSNVISQNSNYQEAWFFGYHSDVGGGAKEQGLALWPLQWILNSAIEQGLQIDSAGTLYDVLFKGNRKFMDIPPDTEFNMVDMTHHHNTKSFGLRLNQPFSIMTPDPRCYFQFLNKAPFKKSKVFIHPSTYLVFDMYSSMRVQIYQWKYFGKYLRDRSTILPPDRELWWEKQTVNKILRRPSADVFNLLVIGKPGKELGNIMTRIFGQSKPRNQFSLETPVEIQDNRHVRIYYSMGNDSQTDLEWFLRCQREKGSPIHVVWYFLDCDVSQLPLSERGLSEVDFGKIPILTIIYNEGKKKQRIRAEMRSKGAALLPWLLNRTIDSIDQRIGKNLNYLKNVSINGIFGSDFLSNSSGRFQHSLVRDFYVRPAFKKELENLKRQLDGLPVCVFVQENNPNDLPNAIVTEAAFNVENEEANMALIKAQRLDFYRKTALATEEALRAYTTWYSTKTGGSYVGTNGTATLFKTEEEILSIKLIDPVVSTFNMGPRVAKQIQLKIGSVWGDLNAATSEISEPNIPGTQILLCMLDALLVITYALSHQKQQNETPKPKGPGQLSEPLNRPEINDACDWYKGRGRYKSLNWYMPVTWSGRNYKTAQDRQLELHKKIKALLDAKGLPKDGSIANLQMKIIEVVDGQTEKTRNYSPTGFIGKALKYPWVRTSLIAVVLVLLISLLFYGLSFTPLSEYFTFSSVFGLGWSIFLGLFGGIFSVFYCLWSFARGLHSISTFWGAVVVLGFLYF